MRERRWTKELIDEATRLRFEERLSMREIGDKYGVSRERIRQVIGNTGRYLLGRRVRNKHINKQKCSDDVKEEISKKRFMEKIIKDRDTGCWIWNGGRNNYKYGAIYCFIGNEIIRMGIKKYAHYIKYGNFVGGKSLKYKCGNPLCCNPDHEVKKNK